MDSPIIISWMSPLSFLGVLGVIFILGLLFFISFFDEISLRSAASHLGLFCLPMSHKKEARLK